jgi:hypothetical protein
MASRRAYTCGPLRATGWGRRAATRPDRLSRVQRYGAAPPPTRPHLERSPNSLFRRGALRPLICVQAHVYLHLGERGQFDVGDLC